MRIVDLADKSKLEILEALDITPSAFSGAFFSTLTDLEQDGDFDELSTVEKRQWAMERALHLSGFANAIAKHPTFNLHTNVDIHVYATNNDCTKLQSILERINVEDDYTKIYIHGVTYMYKCSIVDAARNAHIVFPDLVYMEAVLLKISHLEVPELCRIDRSSIHTQDLAAPNIADISTSTIIVSNESLNLGRNGDHIEQLEVIDSNIISLDTTVLKGSLYKDTNTILSLDPDAACCNVENLKPFTIDYLDPSTVSWYSPNVLEPKKFILADGMLTEVLHSRGNIHKIRTLVDETVLFLAIDPEHAISYHATSVERACTGLNHKRQITLDTEEQKTAKVADLYAAYKEFFTEETATLDHTNLKALYHELTGSCDLGMENFIRTHTLNREYTCNEFIVMLEQKQAYCYKQAIELLKACLDKAKENNQSL